MIKQLTLFPELEAEEIEQEAERKFRIQSFTREQLKKFDYILIAFSGGKDSLCLVLHLLILLGKREDNANPCIELIHHDVDGIYYKWLQKYGLSTPHPEFHDRLMQAQTCFDWPCAIPYVRAIAEYLQLPLYISWLEGGLEEEMLKDNAPSRDTFFESPDGLICRTSKSKINTRLKFPAQSADLRTRWCSSSGKIAVGNKQITNQPRFKEKKILFCTGERAEESANRAKYFQSQPHVTHCQSRNVTHWRPLLHWRTKNVWDCIQKSGIVPAPPYYLGFGRMSCRTCIFLNNRDWATLNRYSPDAVEKIAGYEKQFRTDTFGGTIQQPGKGKRGKTVLERASTSQPREADSSFWSDRANSDTPWTSPIWLSKTEWSLPSGAFGDLRSGSS